jgi:hypothetical protein
VISIVEYRGNSGRPFAKALKQFTILLVLNNRKRLDQEARRKRRSFSAIAGRRKSIQEALTADEPQVSDRAAFAAPPTLGARQVPLDDLVVGFTPR